MRVSVALATYKGEKYIDEQLRSLAEQSELPCELVVSDDNSPDNTLARVERFAQTAPFPVRILPKHVQLGYADNFLHAAENCVGELVAFCDQDDRWHRDKIRRSTEALLRDGSLLSMHTLTLASPTLEKIGHSSQGIHVSASYSALKLDPYLTGYGNTMTFRRDLLNLVPVDRRPKADGKVISHDQWVYTLAAALGTVSHLAESLICYRRHGDNVSYVDQRGTWQRIRDLATFNSTHHAHKASFYGGMAAAFADLAERQPLWRAQALAAAECYYEREAKTGRRLDLYGGRNLAGRVRALDFHVGRNQLAKDILLGVSGLGWRS